ncbi:MAG: Dabb family protein [Chloroflexaceae bacterium]|nr:Dabb family protein [Chloroflexaceae bacterium]
MIRHMVLFRRHPDASDHQIAALLAMLRKLPETIPEIRSFEVANDEVGSDRSATFGLLSHFDDMAALRRYQEHPDHQAVVAHIRVLTEWSRTWDYTVETSESSETCDA